MQEKERFVFEPFFWAEMRACIYLADLKPLPSFLFVAHLLHRTSKLEMLDEIEEMELLFAHYFISWGWRASRSQVGSGGIPEQVWGL